MICLWKLYLLFYRATYRDVLSGFNRLVILIIVTFRGEKLRISSWAEIFANYIHASQNLIIPTAQAFAIFLLIKVLNCIQQRYEQFAFFFLLIKKIGMSREIFLWGASAFNLPMLHSAKSSFSVSAFIIFWHWINIIEL